MKKNSLEQKGQILLIILLIMVVGLTIGLSLSTRSVTDIKISSQLEQSSQAFSAAEAGIEAALKGEAAGTYSLGNASYTLSTAVAGGSDQPLSLGKIGVADSYTVWLTSHDGSENLQIGDTYEYKGSSIDICWDQAAAMEVGVFYKDGASYKVSRGAYDSDSNRRNTNKFSAVDAGVNCGGTFTSGKRISLPTGLLIALRLRPFYSETNLAIAPQSGQSLPSQGLSISSSGMVGETTRKVTVIQSYPALPAIFDYVLFSGTGVNK